MTRARGYLESLKRLVVAVAVVRSRVDAVPSVTSTLPVCRKARVGDQEEPLFASDAAFEYNSQ